MILNLRLVSNSGNKTVAVDDNTKLEDVLTSNDFNLNSNITVNGMQVSPVDLDRTLADLHVSNGSYITAIVKADNACYNK